LEDFDSDLCHLLLNCLKRGMSAEIAPGLSNLSPESWRALLKLAAEQRVIPLLWHRIKEKGVTDLVPIEVADAFRKSVRINTVRNLRLYGELRRLLLALKSEGIELILLKGIYLATAVYEQIGLREMNDIDVLARPSDLPRIVEIMKNLGYLPSQPICLDVIFQSMHHLPPLAKEGGAFFELHWNIVGPGLSHSIDSKHLWEQVFPVQVIGCDALAFSPENLLLHLCEHASHHHQFNSGLRPFCDIAETIHRFRAIVDWTVVVERAIARKWQRGVYLALRLAKEMVEADVPAFVLEKLRPQDGIGIPVETAYFQTFSRKSVPESFARLLESKGSGVRLKIFLRRVFLPRATIAYLYSLPADSAKIYIFYLRRFFDVLRRHGKTLRKFHQKDAFTQALAERTNAISKWLAS
jgi:hypothetical protein